MAFQRAILPAVLSWADKLVMIGKYWNTYLIACQCYIYYIAYTGAPFIILDCLRSYTTSRIFGYPQAEES